MWGSGEKAGGGEGGKGKESGSIDGAVKEKAATCSLAGARTKLKTLQLNNNLLN